MRFVKEKKLMTLILLALTIFTYIYLTKPVKLNSKSDPKSKFYINDLYSSEGRIYENYLNKDEKKLYMTILDDVRNHRVSRIIPLSEYNCSDHHECYSMLLTLYDVFVVEYPEAMDFSTFMWDSVEEGIKLTYLYATPIKAFDIIGEQRIKRIINDMIIETKDMTDEEKVLYVYDYMGENFKYDKVFTYTSKNQSVFNVFIRKNAVCAGFAKASQIIFQNIGIESYGITGESTGPHMWNVIKLKGKYYYFDATVAVSIRDKSKSYFYKGLDQTYLNNYTADHPEWYPTIEQNEYTKLNGRKIEFID